MITSADEGPVRWIVFDRPERRNAFTADDYLAFRGALDAAAADDGVRVVALAGTGPAFSAGADRSLLDGAAPGAAGDAFDALVTTLATFEKPLLAAVNGAAVGFGCTLLLHCDLVVVASSARLRLPFTALGLAPEAASSVLLADRVGAANAAWAMLTSEWIDADTACRMGLTWRSVADDELRDEVQAVAAAIAEHDPAAVVATKRLLRHGRAEAVAAAMARELAAARDLRAMIDP